MDVCPKTIHIRRTKTNNDSIKTDRLEIIPTDECIASINNIIVNFDETVSVKFLGFHAKNNMYCKTYKNPNAKKIFCKEMIMKYVHFYFSVDTGIQNNDAYLVAFLPRTKTTSELTILAEELCAAVKWLEIQQINCFIFRFGVPSHGTENAMHWQKQLNKNINEMKERLFITNIQGTVREVSRALSRVNLTISKESQMYRINVS